MSPRVVFLRGCVSKGHVSEDFDVSWGGVVWPKLGCQPRGMCL